jgi:cytoskeletal protein CcmA (bactofilin family)
VDPPPVTPVRTPEPEPIRPGSAMIGKSVTIRGQIYSREDLTIDGEVEGTIEASEHRITIGPNGRVRATVKAREILILGQLYGNVEAGDKAEIRRDAKLVGDVRTMRIAIEDGAWFKGSIDIVRPEAPKVQPKPAATAPHSATTPGGPPLPPVVISTPAANSGTVDTAPAEVKL